MINDYATLAHRLSEAQDLYIASNKTLHMRFTDQGGVMFWANWKGEETQVYPTLKQVLDDLKITDLEGI